MKIVNLKLRIILRDLELEDEKKKAEARRKEREAAEVRSG